jgi:hypothetical protein
MKIFLSLALMFIIMNTNGQTAKSDFDTIRVNKQIKEFPDQFDLSAPLKSCVTLNYIIIHGKNNLLRSVCSAGKKSLCPDSTAADSQVPENVKNLYLSAVMNEVITYKDSIAFVIVHLNREGVESYYSVRIFYLELGKWLNYGEDLYNNIRQARQSTTNRSDFFYEEFRQTQRNFY